MVLELQTSKSSGIIYPETDGKPIADNTLQFRWIVKIKENLEILFANNADVFIAGDLLLYPVEGNNTITVAPDAMVVFGRPKGDRRSYLQWQEDNITPQVVFEVLSHSNTQKEMAKKLEFYRKYDVEEYYLIDPYKIELCGWLRNNDDLTVIDDIENWVSPQLNIRFELTTDKLEIYYPHGKRFLTPVELAQKAEAAEQQLAQAEARIRRLEEQLKAAGIDPEQL
ncbi:MAG: Uma2 family endonuclease [Microcoleaceae cyanobacterium]